MGVVYAQGMFFCGNVVAQCQIQLIGVAGFPCNRRDGVMGFTVCLCKNEDLLIGVSPPLIQYVLCQVDQPLFILVTDTEYGKGPFYDACLYILVSWNCYGLLNRSLCHSEGIVSSLEMIMTQDGASYNRKICIGAQEVVREQFNKVKQFRKCRPVDFHGRMLSVEYDAVLIIVYIR